MTEPLDLAKVAELVRAKVAEFRKFGEGKDLDSEDWDSLEEGLDYLGSLADTLDSADIFLGTTETYLEDFEDL